jgi:methyl-accepting chemotaxis protein WspA
MSTPPAAPRRTLAGRLTFWFLVLALAPLAVVAGLTDLLAGRAAEHLARRSLSNIADNHAEKIEGYCAALGRSVTALAHAPGVVAGARDPAAAGDALRAFLVYNADAFDLADLFLVAPGGEVRLSARRDAYEGHNVRAGAYADSELARLVERVQALVQTDACDFQRYPGRDEPVAFIAGPVLDGGKVVGVLGCRLDNAELFRALGDLGGLGATGETVVAARVGGEVVVVAPTRHDPAAAFARKVPPGAAWAAPLEAGMAGTRGFGVVPDYRGEEVVGAWRHLPTFRWGVLVKQDAREAFALRRATRLVGLALAVLLLPAVVAAALLVARSIARPLRAGAGAARRVADGDLTAAVDVPARADETGELLRAFGEMVAGLNALVGRVKAVTLELTSMATELAATGRQQQGTAQDFGASASQIAAAVTQISATSRALLGTVDGVGREAAAAAELAGAGRSGLTELGEAMRHLAQGATAIGARLAAIREEAAGVQVVVTTITKVADQTNLLSVNAAIEAEKAGEAGRGFLVVAREIRRLADQTAVATLDIERMVGRMGAAVTAGVMEMDRFAAGVRGGVAAAEGIAGQMGRIIEGAQAASGRFEEVRAGVRDQAEGAQQISAAMQALSEGARQTAASAGELKAAAEHLRDAVAGLKQEVARFRV